jgi:hypothetical protein
MLRGKINGARDINNAARALMHANSVLRKAVALRAHGQSALIIAAIHAMTEMVAIPPVYPEILALNNANLNPGYMSRESPDQNPATLNRGTLNRASNVQNRVILSRVNLSTVLANREQSSHENSDLKLANQSLVILSHG